MNEDLNLVLARQERNRRIMSVVCTLSVFALLLLPEVAHAANQADQVIEDFDGAAKNVGSRIGTTGLFCAIVWGILHAVIGAAKAEQDKWKPIMGGVIIVIAGGVFKGVLDAFKVA